MFEKLEITRMAQAMARHAGARLGLVAQNVAQADTPGYKAQDLPDFADSYRGSGGEALRTTRPGHLRGTDGGLAAQVMTDRAGASPNGNTVSIETEMVKAVGVRQQHEMALAIYRNTSEIIRASLGRGR